MLNTGVEHILHQVVDAKMYTEFLPKINDFIADNHEKLLKVGRLFCKLLHMSEFSTIYLKFLNF